MPIGSRAGTTALRPTAPATVSPSRTVYDAQTELNKRRRALLDLNNPSNPMRSADNAAGRGLLEMYNPANPLRQASNTAERGLLELSNPANGLRAASNAGKRALLDTTGRQSQQQRGYYGTVGGMIGERTAETGRLITARNDVQDLTAVAQAQGHRNALHAIQDAVGIPRAIEIDTPAGDTTALPVGVARSLRSNAEYIGDEVRDKEAVRTNTLAALKNALDITGLDVGDVRRSGDYADLNLSEATQGASYRSKSADLNLSDANDVASYLDKLSTFELQQALSELGFERDEAEYDLSDAKRAPYGQVLYEDPFSGDSRYVTPAEKDRLDFQYAQQLQLERIPAQQNLQAERQRQENSRHPWAGLPESTVVQMYVDNPGLVAEPQSLSMLMDYFINKGLTPYQAGARANDVMRAAEAEIARRKAAEEAAKKRAGGGGRNED
jgi:hypothetical protein